MSEELFEIKTCSVPELELARINLAKAEEAYNKAWERHDVTGEPMDSDILRNLRKAQTRLARAEHDRLNKA